MSSNYRSIDESGKDVWNVGGALKFLAGGTLAGAGFSFKGTCYYVDGTDGDDDNDGLTWAGAFKTIATAAALLEAGDTIFIKGSFDEEVEIDVAGVSIIGVGTTSNQALWTGAADEVCLTISAAADVVVKNIRFRPPAYSAGTPAAISLEGASHQAQIIGCRFQGRAGSYYAIKTDGGQSNVLIKDCEFYYVNTATHGHGIYGHTYTGSEPSGWMIEDCKFHSNTNHIVCRMRQSIIQGCVFAGKGLNAAGAMAAPSKCIDISGATGGCNIVTKNFLGGDYSTALYVSGTDDDWTGNISGDVDETEVGDQGITVAVPAA
jgi:hypothetical protein